MWARALSVDLNSCYLEGAFLVQVHQLAKSSTALIHIAVFILNMVFMLLGTSLVLGRLGYSLNVALIDSWVHGSRFIFYGVVLGGAIIGASVLLLATKARDSMTTICVGYMGLAILGQATFGPLMMLAFKEDLVEQRETSSSYLVHRSRLSPFF